MDKICKYFEVPSLHSTHHIRFKKKIEGKSKAHKLANRTYKGRRKTDYLIKGKDMDDLMDLIPRIIL